MVAGQDLEGSLDGTLGGKRREVACVKTAENIWCLPDSPQTGHYNLKILLLCQWKKPCLLYFWISVERAECFSREVDYLHS